MSSTRNIPATMNAPRAVQNASLANRKAEVTKLEIEKEDTIQAIKDRVSASMVKHELPSVMTNSLPLWKVTMKNRAQ